MSGNNEPHPSSLAPEDTPKEEVLLPINELSVLGPSNQGATVGSLEYPGIGSFGSATDIEPKGRIVGTLGGGQENAGPLLEAVYDHRQNTPRRWEVVMDDDAHEVERAAQAVEIQKLYLLESAVKLHAAGEDGALWADRYTSVSKELYGAPDQTEARMLLERQRTELAEVPEFDDLSGAVKGRVAAFFEKHVPAAEIGEYMESEYGEVLDLVEPDRMYTSVQAVDLMISARDMLAQTDTDWGKWDVRLGNQKHLSVNAKHPEQLEFIVGDGRPDMSSVEFRGLLAHEMLLHGVRATNGWKTGDPMMGAGFPKYDGYEEGQGLMREIAQTGQIPRKHEERYTDIALALGFDGAERLSRVQLVEFVADRSYLLGRGSITYEDAEKIASGHVNRIYKGGPGDDSEAGRAVLTKDVIYYDGLAQALEGHKKLREEGYTTAEIMKFTELGKFVQCDDEQRDYVEERFGYKLGGTLEAA